MEVHVNLELRDFKALIAYLQRLPSRGRGIFWTRLMTFGVGILLGVFLALYDGLGVAFFHWPSAAVGFLVSFVVIFTCLLYVIRRLFDRLLPASDSCRLGPQRYLLSEEGIRNVSSLADTLYRWSAVRHLGETPRHLFVLVDGTTGFVLPKRCFANHRAIEEFKLFAIGHLEPECFAGRLRFARPG